MLSDMMSVFYAVTNNPFMLSVIMLHAIILSVIMLSVVMLSVIMLNVIMLNVVAPCQYIDPIKHFIIRYNK